MSQELLSFTQDGKHALVCSKWADVISAALLTHQGCEPADKAGRGGLLRFHYPEGSGLIRPYRRGGIIRYFLRDQYIFINRPLRELHLHMALYAQGLPVPPPLGACWQRNGIFVRGAFATRELDAVDLLWLFQQQPARMESTLPLCGAAIRQLHDADVFHADLQIKNILIQNKTIYLIDFDRARAGHSLTSFQRAKNLYRLRRSMLKNHFPPEYFR